MNLHELRDLIESSSATDWLRLNHAGTPQFIPLLKQGGSVELDVNLHHTLLTYVENVDVQVAYGMDADYPGTGSQQHHKLSFDWAKDFLHPTPTRVLVQYLHGGNIVDEVSVLSFDGAWMPFPEHASGGYRFSGPSLRIARLLQALDYPNDAAEQESLIHFSGLPVVE